MLMPGSFEQVRLSIGYGPPGIANRVLRRKTTCWQSARLCTSARSRHPWTSGWRGDRPCGRGPTATRVGPRSASFPWQGPTCLHGSQSAAPAARHPACVRGCRPSSDASASPRRRHGGFAVTQAAAASVPRRPPSVSRAYPSRIRPSGPHDRWGRGSLVPPPAVGAPAKHPMPAPLPIYRG
jgi:hypothetical protein